MDDGQRKILRDRYLAGDTEAQAAKRAGVTTAEVFIYWAWYCDRLCRGDA